MRVLPLMLAAGLGSLVLLTSRPRAETTKMRGVVEYGRVISGYGCRARPGLVAGTRIGPCPDRQQFHLAIDIAAAMGDAIFAANDGIVGAVHPDGSMRGYGNTVIIFHADGYATLYAHQQSYVVVAGQRVTQGQKIGHVGITEAGAHGPRALSGALMTPHCHFEVLTKHTHRAAGFETRPTAERPRIAYPLRIDPMRYLHVVNFTPFAHPFTERRRAA